MTKEELLQQRNDLAETIRDLKDLLVSAGWKKYIGVIAQQIEARKQNVLFSPLESADAVFRQEYEKGEISSLMLAERLVESMIDDLSEQLTAMEPIDE